MRLIMMLCLLINCLQYARAEEALLASHRIVGYYGNFYSPKMGVLGKYPPEEMLQMLDKEVHKWTLADPLTPVIPAIEYIAVVAQNHPGVDEKYRTRMPEAQIEKAIALANQINGLAILDIQLGLSTVQTEVPRFASYLALPNVTLALDPEFSMPIGTRPGKVIGTMDAKDINYVIQYLAEIVRKHQLPPKVLIVHRFTQHMVTHYEDITPLPEVQVVMNMDGWGSQTTKMNTYREFIAPESVQFTGVKLFYIEDRKAPSTGLLTPEHVLQFQPVPKFILYQ